MRKPQSDKAIDLLTELTELPTVTGTEHATAERLREIVGDVFDEYITTPVGDHIFIRRCGKENARSVFLDCHYDEIGLVVTDITDEGFVRVSNIGGMDKRTLPAAQMIIYGKKTIRCVVTATPPHLQKTTDPKKMTPINELLLDTGYTAEKLKELVSPGDRVGYPSGITKLSEKRFCGKSFDNKTSGVIALTVLDMLRDEQIPVDIIVAMSASEETGLFSGATAAFASMPDAAFVIDVDLALAPGVDKTDGVEVGAGPSIAYSMVTDRALTDSIIGFAKSGKLPYQTTVSAKHTGTNADLIGLTGNGIPAVVIGIPLKNMHTGVEIFDMKDMNATADLIAEYILHGLEKFLGEEDTANG